MILNLEKMLYERFVFLILFILQATLIMAQGSLLSKPKEMVLKLDTDFRYTLKDRTDFYVIDGILLSDNESIPSTLIIDRTWKVKDSTLLKDLKIDYYTKSYTFYFSSVTPFHKYVYNLTDMPVRLKDLNVPIRIGGHLIKPNEYETFSQIDNATIVRTKYIPNNQLKNHQNLIYGLIDVYLKRK
ncbi:hypothetical protein WBJ53_07290 [Spirosoma sp. SC4-14]|uniref:hypothetical protein n=1 Tax=Spirosoma sp. SC4-14 TaxID=3128900 RepID=UPI0030D19590